MINILKNRTFLTIFLIVNFTIMAVIAYYTHFPRKPDITITSQISMFDSPDLHSTNKHIIQMITPETEFEFLNVKYSHDYIAIHIKTKEGNTGWIFYGDGVKVKH